MRFDDQVYCYLINEPKSYFQETSHPSAEGNYKKYGKAFDMSQNSYINIYNIDVKMYIRIFAKHGLELPYIAKYCEE